MKKIFYTLLAFIIFSFQFSICEAQTWQWGVTQGTNSADDRVEDMATDIYGNIYLVSRIGKNAPYASSVSLPNGKGIEDRHTMLVSYDCNGKYRWSKVIGGGGLSSTKSLRITQSGNVYLFGMVPSLGSSIFKAYYDSDTATPGLIYQKMSLICYDTLGNFKWLRRPDSITSTAISVYNQYHPMSMDIDELGNAYCLVTMPPSSKILGSSLTIPTTTPFKGLGAYVLKYNPSGTLLSVTMLKDFCFINGAGSFIPGNTIISYNKFNKGYLISSLNFPSSGDSLYIKNIVLRNNVFFGSFIADGSLKWHFTDTATKGGNYAIFKAAQDDSSNIIIGGSLGDNNYLNGHVFDNPYTTIASSGMPFIMKIDSNGIKKWCINGGTAASSGMNEVSYFATNHKYAAISSIAFLTRYFGDPYKDTIMVNHYKTGGPGQDGWYAIVDIKTGKTVKLATARGDGFYDGITGLLFKGDDLYMAGHTESDSIIIDSTFSVKKKAGTGIDVFLAKYSFKCGCVGTPLATYSYASGSNTFSFTGTTPADSVTWDFGDGSTGKGLSIFHSYAKKGKYKVCATLWSPTCGPVYYCDSINVTLSIHDAVAYRNLRIYPNPTKDYLNIDGLPSNTELSLYSIVGQKISTKVALSTTEQIDLNGLAAGLYIIQIKDEEGNVYSAKVMKE